MATFADTVGAALIPGLNTQILSPDPAYAPVIDFGCLQHKHTAARALAVEDIGRACQQLGCFQVINHGINKSVITGALEVASDFFEQTTEENKAEFASEDVTKPVRYSAYSTKGTSDKTRAFLKQYAHPLNDWIGLWPRNPPSYREKMAMYATEVRRVALQLMDAILESLGLGQAYLIEKLDEGMQVMTLNHYKQCGSQQQEPQLGLAPHSDYGCITILVQSCQGLQFIDRNAGAWRAVPDVPETLHVHIGDYLEVLSNGRYKTVVHQAVLNTDRRISIASIHSLSMDEKVTAAEGLVDQQHPNGYRDSSFRDFLDYLSATDGRRSFIDSLRI